MFPAPTGSASSALLTAPPAGARRIHGLRYTISDGRVFDARSQLEDVRGMVEEAGW